MHLILSCISCLQGRDGLPGPPGPPGPKVSALFKPGCQLFLEDELTKMTKKNLFIISVDLHSEYLKLQGKTLNLKVLETKVFLNPLSLVICNL